MVRNIIFWVIAVAMLIGGFVAEGPANGVVGVTGLWCIAGSWSSRKDGGVDQRVKIRWVRLLVGLALLAVAFIITALE